MPLNALSSHLWNVKGNTFRFHLRTWGWADGIWTSRWRSGHHQEPGRLFPRTRKEGSQRRVRTVFKEKRKSSKAEKWPWASDTQEPQTVNRRTSQESTEGQSRHRQHSVTLALWDETWEWCQQSGLCGTRWTWTWDRTGLRLDDHLLGVLEMGFFQTSSLCFSSSTLHPSPPCSGPRKLIYVSCIRGILALWIQLGSENRKPQLETGDGEENEVGISLPPACLLVGSPWGFCVPWLKVTASLRGPCQHSFLLQDRHSSLPSKPRDDNNWTLPHNNTERGEQVGVEIKQDWLWVDSY